MSTALEERVDLNLVVIEEPADDDNQECDVCEETAEWVGVLTCGHAPPFCVRCKERIDLLAESNSLMCGSVGMRGVRVVRWEKK